MPPMQTRISLLLQPPNMEQADKDSVLDESEEALTGIEEIVENADNFEEI